MGDYLILNVYVDKDKNIILLPYKECSAGYAVASEPYKKYGAEEWGNVAVHVIELLDEVAKQPIAEGDIEDDILKQIFGSRGFRQFSKKHLCIQIMYKITEKVFVISNEPRLSDGSYGSEKDSVSEMFSTKYTSLRDATLIQENFLKAYKDAGNYLKKIGSEL